mgnify:FL=1
MIIKPDCQDIYYKDVKQKCLTSFLFCSILPKVIVMEKIVEQGLLYDFYGELLTEHQKKIYEDVVYNDLSLTEIAKENGISRQGVHDLVRRCNHILQEYEDKLHLIARFMKVKKNIGQLQELTNDTEISREELIQKVGNISRQILEEL